MHYYSGAVYLAVSISIRWKSYKEEETISEYSVPPDFAICQAQYISHIAAPVLNYYCELAAPVLNYYCELRILKCFLEILNDTSNSIL